MEAYSFVVTYRREERVDPNAPATWRGWVQCVYQTDGEGPGERRYFIDVSEVSGVIAKMIRDAGGPDAR